MLWCSVALLALFASVQGRAVNISNTWVLPEEGFPVFYRYFRDRISWYEADAVCQFHHANLVTVDTTAQYDAVRAYLKELDISSAVWVGLIRSNPDGDFTWTDYRGLSGDGYWSSAPDARAAPLCAAANPAADYRWEARACGGPTVASFICELPVPQWALGNDGCMVRALPALTILYLPESAAVQLTADCGLAGVKRVQCTGNVKRDDLLRDLSCADEDDLSSTQSLTSTSTLWPITTDLIFTDQDITSEITTEENITTEHETDKPNVIKEISISHYMKSESPKILENTNRLNRVMLTKNINFDVIQSNNLQSNFIPKIVNKENVITNEQQEKLEDEKHMQHKMLHEEIARLGNLDNIFTQPTDHFVPPLVMAKAKISDDMTVLSLKEKHAQQLAEQQISKESLVSFQRKSTDAPKTDNQLDIQSEQLAKLNNGGKKDKIKSYIPKKYYDPKGKVLKAIDTKSFEIVKTTEITDTSTENISKNIETTTVIVTKKTDKDKSNEEDSSMDLTIMIKDVVGKAPTESGIKTANTNYYGDVSKFESMLNETSINETEIKNSYEQKISQLSNDVPQNSGNVALENVTMDHKIITITITSEESSSLTPTVFEITTNMPVIRDSAKNNYSSSSVAFPATLPNYETYHSNGSYSNSVRNVSTTNIMEMEQIGSTSTTLINNFTVFIGTTRGHSENTSAAQTILTTDRTLSTTKTEFPSITTIHPSHDNTHELDIKMTEEESILNISYAVPKQKIDLLNNTEIHDMEFESNSTDMSEEIDDFQSPLLSAANEPLHRPNRSRRPQPQPNRNKFNPFRILG